MEDKKTKAITNVTEEHMLERIVNAMLVAERDLRHAGTHEWNQTLLASCRLQRMAFEGDTCA